MAKSPRETDSYNHDDSSRLNNTTEGFSTHVKDPDTLKTYSFDPNESPCLDWAGKDEASSFTVPTLSIHQHELVNPLRALYDVRSERAKIPERQILLFGPDTDEQRLLNTMRAAQAYEHRENWTNRMIAGDSLLVMNSLLQKENMAGSVQTVYIDPPYGIKYGSNFQPFVNKKDVKDRNDEDLTTEPEMIRAFRDTWELGIHSYLTYLRNRLLLVRELLRDSGSVFVQISDENVHHVRELCDEVFGACNFVSLITFKKTSPLGSKGLAGISDYLVWYAKDKSRMKYRQLFTEKDAGEGTLYTWLELKDGSRRKMTPDEIRTAKNYPAGARAFTLDKLQSAGYTETCMYDFELEGTTYKCGKKSWRTNREGMQRLIEKGRVMAPAETPRYVLYHDDFPVQALNNLWDDTGGATDMRYVVQTSTKVIQRCILMTSDPGDLVLDITCGSGTTAYVAEQWGRRWITCDTSRIALAIARQRLLTATFPYYRLNNPEQGISSGFVYKSVPHITLKSIANNEPPARETLYDQPEIDSSKVRVSGPFTVEALPAPVVLSPEEAAQLSPYEGEHQADWREQLLHTGIRGKNGERLTFSRIEAMTGTRWLNAKAFLTDGRTALVCFADTSALMDSKRVSFAIDELKYQVRPDLLIFAAFQFNPESQDLIANMNLPDVKCLQVKMNDDIVTKDLRKNVKTDDLFWLVGQPDVELVRTKKGKYRVRVLGFDYYNIKTDKIESGGTKNIAMWMLDTDYNGKILRPSQIFFPLGGWENLAKTLKAEIDPDLIEAYSGTESLPFDAEEDREIAVKIIDDRGIDSMRVLKVGAAK